MRATGTGIADRVPVHVETTTHSKNAYILECRIWNSDRKVSVLFKCQKEYRKDP